MYNDKATETNKSLLYVQKKWYDSIVIPYINQCVYTTYSTPFFFSVTNQYLESNNRVMVIGQETSGFCSRDEFSEIEEQNRSRIYFQKQLFGIGSDAYNRSPFWRFIRRLQSMGWITCWNNVDSIMRIVNDKTKPLKLEMEKVLLKPFGAANITLLNYQINIVKPRVVLFLTGPNYARTMEMALGLDKDCLNSYLPIKGMVADITDVCHTLKSNGVYVLWTYHPNYINFCGKTVWDGLFVKLDNLLSKISLASTIHDVSNSMEMILC